MLAAVDGLAELDAASGDHPVVLVSGDGHNGWLNTRALELLGVTPPDRPTGRDRLVPGLRSPWGSAQGRGGDRGRLPQGGRRRRRQGSHGIVDMEFGAGYLDWPERFARGVDRLRVRTATYPDRLEEVIAAGLRSAHQLPGGGGLLTMGPLKVIGDGSLNTRTAYCDQPYAGAAALEATGHVRVCAPFRLSEPPARLRHAA